MRYVPGKLEDFSDSKNKQKCSPPSDLGYWLPREHWVPSWREAWSAGQLPKLMTAITWNGGGGRWDFKATDEACAPVHLRRPPIRRRWPSKGYSASRVHLAWASNAATTLVLADGLADSKGPAAMGPAIATQEVPRPTTWLGPWGWQVGGIFLWRSLPQPGPGHRASPLTVLDCLLGGIFSWRHFLRKPM